MSVWRAAAHTIQKRRLGAGDKVPTDARFDVLETGLGQIPEQGERTLTHLWHFVLRSSRGQREVSAADARRRFIRRGGELHGGAPTCMHWYIRVRMLLRATSCSMVPPKPSARPLRRSRATIMKSLSGASYWSG